MIQVAVVSVEGGSPATLTSGSADNLDPRWSPDGLRIAFRSNRGGPFRTWVLSRDSVGGPWRGPTRLGDVQGCMDWAPDGAVLACTDAQGGLVLVSAHDGRILRSDLLAHSHLSFFGNSRFSRDGRTMYVWGNSEDGRKGIWAISMAGGPTRLVVAFDDPTLLGTGWFSVGPDRLYVTVSHYESDVWVATLKW